MELSAEGFVTINLEEEELSSTMYIAPPLPFAAEQFWIEREFSWKVFDEGMDA